MRVMSAAAAAAAVLEGGHVLVLVTDFHLRVVLCVTLPTTAYLCPLMQVWLLSMGGVGTQDIGAMTSSKNFFLKDWKIDFI